MHINVKCGRIVDNIPKLDDKLFLPYPTAEQCFSIH